MLRESGLGERSTSVDLAWADRELLETLCRTAPSLQALTVRKFSGSAANLAHAKALTRVRWLAALPDGFMPPPNLAHFAVASWDGWLSKSGKSVLSTLRSFACESFARLHSPEHVQTLLLLAGCDEVELVLYFEQEEGGEAADPYAAEDERQHVHDERAILTTVLDVVAQLPNLKRLELRQLPVALLARLNDRPDVPLTSLTVFVPMPEPEAMAALRALSHRRGLQSLCVRILQHTIELQQERNRRMRAFLGAFPNASWRHLVDEDDDVQDDKARANRVGQQHYLHYDKDKLRDNRVARYFPPTQPPASCAGVPWPDLVHLSYDGCASNFHELFGALPRLETLELDFKVDGATTDHETQRWPCCSDCISPKRSLPRLRHATVRAWTDFLERADAPRLEDVCYLFRNALGTPVVPRHVMRVTLDAERLYLDELQGFVASNPDVRQLFLYVQEGITARYADERESPCWPTLFADPVLCLEDGPSGRPSVRAALGAALVASPLVAGEMLLRRSQ